MQCPVCGASCVAPDRFCAACGARLHPCRPILCPACRFPCSTAMAVCPQCGSPLEAGNGLSAVPPDASLLERALFLLKRSFVRFGDFRGRSSRSEFFLFMAVWQLASLVLASLWWQLASLLGALMLVPGLAVSVRRMRDAGYYPWTPFVLAGVASVLVTFGIGSGLALGFSASTWRLALAAAGVSSALLLAVSGLFLFLVLQPTAEPGEAKRLWGLRPGVLAKAGPQAPFRAPQGPFPGQPGPQGPVPGQPGPQGPVPGQPGPQGPVPGQPGPQGAGSGQPLSCPQQSFPQEAFPQEAFSAPQGAFPQGAFPRQPCQTPFPHPAGLQPGQPELDEAQAGRIPAGAAAQTPKTSPDAPEVQPASAGSGASGLPAGEAPGQPERPACGQAPQSAPAQAEGEGQAGRA